MVLHRTLASAVMLLAGLVVTVVVGSPLTGPSPRLAFTATSGSQASFQSVEAHNKVPVQLAVMSQCPDARIAESVFDAVLDRVGTLVDIELLYIGSVDDEKEYGVECKHGDQECLGNIGQLCAAKYWQGVSGSVNPWADWWNFVQCENYNGLSRIGTEKLAESCASVIGKKWEGAVRECTYSEEGRELLRESVRTSQKLKLVKSCSIVIAGELVCIRDGKWYDCDVGHDVGDFVRVIKDAWNRLNDPTLHSE